MNDVRKEAAASHLKNGATWADTPKAVAEATDVVFTSLPGPVEVEAVALGPTGLLAGMSAGKAIGIALMAVALAVVAFVIVKHVKKG